MSGDRFLRLVVCCYMIVYLVVFLALTISARIFGIVFDDWVDLAMGWGLINFIVAGFIFFILVIE